MEGLHKENVVLSQGTPRYLIIIIRRKVENVMHNVVLLHAAAITEKVHFIHLLLVLFLQLLILSGEPSLQLIFFFNSKPCLLLLHIFLLSRESSAKLLYLPL